MYQDFGKTPYGFIRIDTQAIVSLVSRHLPSGALCTAVRMRPHDRLCLVVISDRREFWSREDDLCRARAITDDLRDAGMELPRLRWIRQSRFPDQSPLVERRAYDQPSFWMNIAGAVFAFFALSLWGFLCYAGLLCAAWFISAWLISGGWSKIERLLPFLASFLKKQYNCIARQICVKVKKQDSKATKPKEKNA